MPRPTGECRLGGRSRWRAARLVGVTVVVMTQDLSSNEEIRIAADDPIARDHIARKRANAGAKSIIGVSLSVVGCGCSTILLGATSRIDSLGIGHGGERNKHAKEPVLCRRYFHCRTCLVRT